MQAQQEIFIFTILNYLHKGLFIIKLVKSRKLVKAPTVQVGVMVK